MHVRDGALQSFLLLLLAAFFLFLFLLGGIGICRIEHLLSVFHVKQKRERCAHAVSQLKKGFIRSAQSFMTTLLNVSCGKIHCTQRAAYSQLTSFFRIFLYLAWCEHLRELSCNLVLQIPVLFWGEEATVAHRHDEAERRDRVTEEVGREKVLFEEAEQEEVMIDKHKMRRGDGGKWLKHIPGILQETRPTLCRFLWVSRLAYFPHPPEHRHCSMPRCTWLIKADTMKSNDG